MKIPKQKINIILIAVLVHLIIFFILMLGRLGTISKYEESFTYIELEFLKEMSKNLEEQLKEENNDQEAIDIENYIASLRNVGISGSYDNYNIHQSGNSLSEQELKEKYESEILKEKYGDNYSEAKKRNYENYLPENENTTNKKDKTNIINEKQENTHNGQALVYVELENKKRGNSYIYVPVFTCKSGGKVVVNITISSDGKVKAATIASIKSNEQDASCIENAAKDAAMKSKFISIIGTSTEKGKITYTFIDQ